jgi:hypothetical protein
LGDQIENNEAGGAGNMSGEVRDAYRVIVGKPEGKF